MNDEPIWMVSEPGFLAETSLGFLSFRLLRIDTQDLHHVVAIQFILVSKDKSRRRSRYPPALLYAERKFRSQGVGRAEADPSWMTIKEQATAKASLVSCEL
jgi:hypothetical protein